MVNKTQRHRNHWTQWTVAEITFVEQHYGQLSAREIGKRIGRSANGVARIVHLSGLSRGVAPPWSEEEQVLLRTHYTEGIEYVMSLLKEKLPHRTIPAIKHRATSLGLRSFKRKKRVSRVRYDGGG